MQDREKKEHQVTEGLRSPESQFTALLNNIKDMVCSRDLEGALLVWNEAFAESIRASFGVEPFVGMKTMDYIPPEQQGNFIEQIEKFQLVLKGEKQISEFSYTMPNGESIHFEITWSPMWQDEKIVGAVEYIRDITERKKVEEELHKSDERYKSFIKSSSEAIWCFEVEQPISVNLPVEEQFELVYKYAYLSEANDAYARIMGYEKGEDLQGFRLADIMPRSMPESVATIEKVITEKYNIVDVETNETSKNGEIKFFLNNIVGIIEDGHLLRAWGTSRNITEKKKLEQKIQESQKDLQQLAGRLLSIQEEERRRLARELHDDLTQRLAIVAIEVGKLRIESSCSNEANSALGEIQEKLIKVSEDINSISRQLHPSIIEDLGLEDALKSEINKFSQREDIPVIFESNLSSIDFSREKAICLFRITQESLRNIMKHSDADKVIIQLVSKNGSLILKIKDNGKGFDPDLVKKMPGLGLKSMRERIRLVNGTISFNTQLDKGTEVVAEIDCP
jgi:PAS domain S-box-containing protein